MILGSQQHVLRDILASQEKKKKINYVAILLYKRTCYLLAFLSILKKMLPNWQEIVIAMATFGMSSAYNSALAIPCMQIEA